MPERFLAMDKTCAGNAEPPLSANPRCFGNGARELSACPSPPPPPLPLSAFRQSQAGGGCGTISTFFFFFSFFFEGGNRIVISYVMRHAEAMTSTNVVAAVIDAHPGAPDAPAINARIANPMSNTYKTKRYRPNEEYWADWPTRPCGGAPPCRALWSSWGRCGMEIGEVAVGRQSWCLPLDIVQTWLDWVSYLVTLSLPRY